ncbi:BEL1-like homeodomain protein 1 [Tanacetum coccineum]|uniref:BEL1-like homeodomain protein 1 n=1 Tax=Tanacetum coccineum TaxID=301880 RepID=A0ABQ4Z6G6_9ASTR
MATYYDSNSEIQGGDGLQTLILMNPGYVNYSDTPQHRRQPPSQQGNIMFVHNHHRHTSLSHTAQPTTSQTQQFVGVPLSVQPSVSIHSQHDMSSLHAIMPRVHYNMYNPVEMTTQPQEIKRFPTRHVHNLSSQQSFLRSQASGVATISPTGDERATGLTPSASGISNGVNGIQSVLLNSKYLKATHELLEEVVNVGKDVFKNSDQSSKSLKAIGSPTAREGLEWERKQVVNVVEQRYRQYHNQMQIVISWFEQAAGIGSAKTYTALALQTISKQFRCLKDAILGQIKTASRSLGEEDSFGGKTEGGSRLKFVDNQLRQQRALQQLGMIQHNAWRPQRGLPERSVSVLRAWLFEHFLHPYPKDSDKHMLAKQTGLTRGQVSNWFINARVRLWKPMVEEMYLEEIKENEQNKSDENNEE